MSDNGNDTEPTVTFSEACTLARVFPDEYVVVAGPISLEQIDPSHWKMRQSWQIIRRQWRASVVLHG